MSICSCINDLKNAETEKGRLLLDSLQKSAQGVVSDIGSTMFYFDDGIPAAFELRYTVSRQMKNGNTLKRTKTIAIRCSYCPICGLDKDGNPGIARDNEENEK